MYRILRKNKEKTLYFTEFALILASALTTTIFLKNENEILDGNTNGQIGKDVTLIKEFVLKKIKSPFINIDYEIKSGDSIQKILKKFKIQNKEIQLAISQYKKYGNVNQLLAGNKIEIIIEEHQHKENNSIEFFCSIITTIAGVLI